MKMDARLVPHDEPRPIARTVPRRDVRGPAVLVAAALCAAAVAVAERPVPPIPVLAPAVA